MTISTCKHLIRIALLLLISGPFLSGIDQAAAGQNEIRVAVATNFIRTMEKIASHYEAETGTSLKLSSGATGMLYAQIVNSAPYDLFLAADIERPEFLHQQDLCEAPFAYATGRVVLWSNRLDLNEAESWQQVVVRDDILRIALANPETAPYGAAVTEVLQKTGLGQRLQKHLVFGQNVGQAFQYSQQGAVDLAFVAFSFALSEHGRKGKTWLLREALPVVQKGCTLKSSANRESVHDLIAYLQTEQAKNILSEFGYE